MALFKHLLLPSVICLTLFYMFILSFSTRRSAFSQSPSITLPPLPPPPPPLSFSLSISLFPSLCRYSYCFCQYHSILLIALQTIFMFNKFILPDLTKPALKTIMDKLLKYCLCVFIMRITLNKQKNKKRMRY